MVLGVDVDEALGKAKTKSGGREAGEVGQKRPEKIPGFFEDEKKNRMAEDLGG